MSITRPQHLLSLLFVTTALAACDQGAIESPAAAPLQAAAIEAPKTLPQRMVVRATLEGGEDPIHNPLVIRTEHGDHVTVADYGVGVWERGSRSEGHRVTRSLHGEPMPECGQGVHPEQDAIEGKASGSATRGEAIPADQAPLDGASGHQGFVGGSCVDTVDLLVAYTTNALINAGGLAALHQRIQRDVTMGNLAMGNLLESGSVTPPTQYRVVRLEPVSFNDAGLSSDAIIAALANNNGTDPLDGLHDLRDEVGADMVVLYAHPGLFQSCGQVRRVLNNLNTAPIAYQDGFAWVNTFEWCDWRYAFAHELGHNMGCAHNTNPGTGLLGSSHGYLRNNALGIKGSIMAISGTAEPDQHRLPVYSNPDATWLDLPFGSASTHDCAGTIAVSSETVSAYRPAQIAGGVGLRPATVSETLPRTRITDTALHVVHYDNLGCSELTVTEVSLAGSDPGSFEVVDDTCSDAVIPSGESCTVTVAFSPEDTEVREADLIVETEEVTASWFTHGFTAQGGWIRGDVNMDGEINIADPVTLLNYLFGLTTVPWLPACDVNDDGMTNIADSVFLLDYLFKGGEAPGAPFPGLGG